MSNILLIVVAASSVSAQPPDFYRSVDRIVWVVDDVERVTEAWRKVGLARLDKREEIDLLCQFRGSPAKSKVRLGCGFLGDVRVEWVQPLSGENAYSKFLKEHGNGIFSLVHRVPDMAALQRELDRLGSAGADILQRSERTTPPGVVHDVYLDTAPQGKYVLGLIQVAADSEPAPPVIAPEKKIVQFAFAVHYLKPVSAFWEKLGLGPMALNRGNLSDVRYKGTPIGPELLFGWQRNRKVPYEWLQPASSPNVFDDHMRAHGEGIHHLALTVDDLDKATAQWTQLGHAVVQSGKWGEEGKKGSGRFAYIDTESAGGMMIELLWNHR